jgi:membrane protein DedA with SNARE-associated domain/membrane-associated phospholipid phosphatase
VVEHLAERILALHGWVALAVVFAVPALEASAFVGFVFPGEIAIILGGVLAFEGRIGLAATIVAAVTGAVVGDTVGYWVGRRWGRRMLQGPLARVVQPHHLDRAERYLAERGGKAVFFGRFTAALRVMIPGLAGMARMPYRTFAFNNLAGGTVWAVAFVLLGYAAGTGWREVEAVAKRASLVLLVLLLVVGGIALAARWVARHPERYRSWVEGQLERPLVARVRVRRRRELEFLARRFKPSGALGLSLTLGVVALVAASTAFALILLNVHGGTQPTVVDTPTYEFFLEHREPWLTRALTAVTHLGDPWVVTVLTVVVGLAWRWRGGSWRPLVLLVCARLGALACWGTLKALVPRPRPPASLALTAAQGTAFPSAHAVDAAAVLGMLAALAAASVPLWSRKVTAWALALAAVAVIGLSRLYLGASWLTDVLGGFALGAGWMLAVLTTAQTLGGVLSARRQSETEAREPSLVPGGPDERPGGRLDRRPDS